MRRCRRQAPPFSGSAPTTFRLYRYSNEGRPLALAATVTYHRIILISCRKTAGGSCRGVRRLAEKGIAGYAHSAAICDQVGDSGPHSTPSSFPAILFNPPSRVQIALRFPGFKGAVAKSQRASSEPAFPIRGISPSVTCSRGWNCERACARLRAELRELHRRWICIKIR